MIAKSLSIKGAGCKSGGCVRKAVELTSGGLPLVLDTGLRIEQSIPTGRQKSAEGVVGAEVLKPRMASVKGPKSSRRSAGQKARPLANS